METQISFETLVLVAIFIVLVLVLVSFISSRRVTSKKIDRVLMILDGPEEQARPHLESLFNSSGDTDSPFIEAIRKSLSAIYEKNPDNHLLRLRKEAKVSDKSYDLCRSIFSKRVGESNISELLEKFKNAQSNIRELYYSQIEERFDEIPLEDLYYISHDGGHEMQVRRSCVEQIVTVSSDRQIPILAEDILKWVNDGLAPKPLVLELLRRRDIRQDELLYVGNIVFAGDEWDKGFPLDEFHRVEWRILADRWFGLTNTSFKLALLNTLVERVETEKETEIARSAIMRILKKEKHDHIKKGLEQALTELATKYPVSS